MDSIFQIKINENKLQKILNELSQNQSKIWTQIQNIQFQSVSNWDQFTTIQKQTQKQIKCLDQKTIQKFNHILQLHSLDSTTLQQNFDNKFEIISSRLILIQQQSAQQHTYLKSEFEDKLQKVRSQLSSLAQRQIYYDKIQKADNRIQRLEKLVGKIIQSTELLHNKNFLYFMQMLIDKQQGISRSQQTSKNVKNPFSNESNQQKIKRYRQFRKCLQQTQSRIQNMQTEYTGYFNSAFQVNKQNRQQTHMHYAFLSTKIKDIEAKLLQQQTLSIQNTEKILYPSQSKQKRQKYDSRAKIDIDNNNCKQIIKQQLDSIVKDKVQSIKKDLNAKFQKMQDKIWSISNKSESFKSNLGFLKSQIQNIQQKWKLNAYYNQHAYEKQNLAPKTIGQLMNQFRNTQQLIQQKLKQKVDGVQFNKVNQQIIEKIKIVNQQVNQKSDRNQTRKAFGFIQQKIKQMITLIAGMQTSSKRTAASRIMLQCLSCDDNYFEETQTPKQPVQKQIKSALTSRASSVVNKHRDIQKIKKQINFQNEQGILMQKQ